MKHEKYKGTWQEYSAEIEAYLKNAIVTDENGQTLEINLGFRVLAKLSETCRKSHGEIIFVGNGASATMASHLSADIFKNAEIRTRVLTDTALLTAMGNDICYEQVYAEPLKLLLRDKDVLVAISSSGSSQNIIEAAKIAKEKRCLLVTFSAFAEDNPLRQMGNLNFYVGAKTFGFAESCHATLLHYWMDCIVLEK